MSTSQNKVNPAPAGLERPGLENGKRMLIAGIRNRYTADAMNKLSDQWQRFAPHIGRVPGQIGRTAYGLVFQTKGSESTEYLSGVEVSSCEGQPAEFDCVTVPEQRYVVFVHQGHVSTIWNTCDAIGKWFPESGYQALHTPGEPDFFERYTQDFNPQTGMGGMEVWVPIK